MTLSSISSVFWSLLFGTVASIVSINITNSIYHNKYINCLPSTEDCIIKCSGNSSCETSIINCPKYHNCELHCLSDKSCLNTHINWPENNGKGRVICTGSQSCDGINFPLPDHYKDYQLICNQTYQCASTHITCPEHADCNISCIGQYSCLDASIIWSLNTSINSVLICLNNDSCLATTRPPIYSIDNDKPFNVLCSQNSECSGSYIICPNNECNIACSGEHSCHGARFKLPENSPFNILCSSADYSCTGITYDHYNNFQPLVLDCSASYMCFETVINCPQNSDCNITCSSSFSCTYATINCPNNSSGDYSCNIWCTDYYSCYGAVVKGYGRIMECSSTASCKSMIFPDPPPNKQYALSCTEYQSCSEAMIRCPSNEECHINCTGTQSCSGSLFVWPTNLLHLFHSTLGCTSNSCMGYVNHPPNSTLTSNANIFDCDTDSECLGAVIECSNSSNYTCNINCDGFYGCTAAVFHSNINQPYSINCSIHELGTCRGTIITQWDENRDFTMHCSGYFTCQQSTIYCPSNADCNIICNEQYSCERITIYGPVNHTLTVTCSEDTLDTVASKACYKATIYAQHSSLFVLNGCSGDNATSSNALDYTCNRITIVFPEHEITDNIPRAIINGSNNAGLNNMKFYSKYGWKDIWIINYDTNFYHGYANMHGINHDGKMFCSSDYSIQCDFAWNGFVCNDYGDTRCNNYTLQLTPTILPTMLPTDGDITDILYGIWINISFECIVINNSVSTDYIEELLINITTNVIVEIIYDNNQQNCVESMGYDINSTNTLNTTSFIISVTIYLCNEVSQQLLKTEIQNTLERDLINTISDKEIILIDMNSVYIIVDEIDIEKNSEMSTTSWFYTSTNLNTKYYNENGNENENITVIILGIIGGIIGLVLIILAVYILFKINQSNNITAEPQPGSLPMSTVFANQKSSNFSVQVADDSDTSNGNNDSNAIKNNGHNSNHATNGIVVDVDIMKEGEYIDEVHRWLVTDCKLPEYYKLFILNGLQSIAQIKELENKDALNDIGIKLIGHQSKLWSEIKILRNEKYIIKEQTKGNEITPDGIDTKTTTQGEYVIDK